MDRFTDTLGAGRGLPAHVALDDEDVLRALLAGQVSQNARFLVLHAADGPDPSACFLVERERVSDDVLRGHGIILARWCDANGTLNVACSPEFEAEPELPVLISRRCARAGARALLTTTVQLGMDWLYASGQRPDFEKYDRSQDLPPYPREGEEWFKRPKPLSAGS